MTPRSETEEDEVTGPTDLSSALSSLADVQAVPPGLAPRVIRTQAETVPGPGRTREASGERRVNSRPSPVPVAAPWVIELVTGVRAGQQVPVSRRRVVVGRSLGALTLDDPSVSEGHASLFLRGEGLVVEDGLSPSGVYLSVGPHVILEPGHVIACGNQVLRYFGPLEPPPDPGSYGSEPPSRAHKVEQVLVGGRAGRVVVFTTALEVGSTEGTLRFPDDELLEPRHAEFKATPLGMELITHSRVWPIFVRMPPGAQVLLDDGALMRIGATTLRVSAVPRR